VNADCLLEFLSRTPSPPPSRQVEALDAAAGIPPNFSPSPSPFSRPLRPEGGVMRTTGGGAIDELGVKGREISKLLAETPNEEASP